MLKKVDEQLSNRAKALGKTAKPPKTSDSRGKAGTQTDDDGKLARVEKLKKELEKVASAARIKQRAVEIAWEHLDSHQSALISKFTEA